MMTFGVYICLCLYIVYMCLYECLNTSIYECLNDLEYKYENHVSVWSIQAAYRSIGSGFHTRTTVDKWELSAVIHQQ
jgi:hypothetical protein